MRAVLVGAGQSGTSLLGQVERTPMLDVPVVCDLDVERAKPSFLPAGYAEDDIVIAESTSARVTSMESGKRVVLADALLIDEIPVDIVVKATGNPEATAQVGLVALSADSILQW